MNDPKPIEFRGHSLEALRHFPETARRRAGHQLDMVQRGQEPDDWKPMNSVGAGVREIRIREERGIYRIIYVCNSQTPFTFCIVFKRRRKRQASQT